MQGEKVIVVASDEPIMREAVAGLVTSGGFGPARPSDGVPPVRVPGFESTQLLLIAAALLTQSDATLAALAERFEAVIVFAAAHDPRIASGMLEAGAGGYLSTRAEVGDLHAAVGTVLAGGVHVPRDLARAILTGRVAEADLDLPKLTSREREVAARLAIGKTTNEIASELFIGATTAKTHLGGLYTKLGVNSRAAAVTRLAQLGLLAELLV